MPVDGMNLKLELAKGEQLTPGDIQTALEDSDIRPEPVHSGDNSGNRSTLAPFQLYFGPGFEDRLELEMEE